VDGVKMDERKEVIKLRAALVMYLAEQGTAIIDTYELGTVELLRKTAEAYMIDCGVQGVVSIHFDNDTR
jgi:hypothetical protein